MSVFCESNALYNEKINKKQAVLTKMYLVAS